MATDHLQHTSPQQIAALRESTSEAEYFYILNDLPDATQREVRIICAFGKMANSVLSFNDLHSFPDEDLLVIEKRHFAAGVEKLERAEQ